GELDRAKSSARELERLRQDNSKDSMPRVERLLREERSLREAALRDAEGVEADATKWLDFQRNLPHYLARLQDEYDAVRKVDLVPVSKVVEKAEQDWTAKKSDLDGRLATLRRVPETVETQG